MKKIQLIALWLMAAMIFHANAQQALYGGGAFVSPEIHVDYTVTFRVLAPSADEVKLTGDWMPAEGWVPGSVIMEKDEKGLCSY